MKKILKVLLVEDSEDDELFLRRELARAEWDVTLKRVQTAGDMRSALAEEDWDIVISDWSMPEFDAPRALDVLNRSELDIPFIIVSGTVGEDVAVEAMRFGARDYIVKGKLTRLRSAIERELNERTTRDARRRAEQALIASELRYRRLLESGLFGVVIADRSGVIREANDAFLTMVGYTRDELEAGAMRWTDLTPREWLADNERAMRQLEEIGVASLWEKEYFRKEGSRVPVMVGIAALDDHTNLSVSLDLTIRKQMEQALKTTEEQLLHAQKMEAIGRLAGGVAHDFNNILMVIIGESENLLQGMAPADPMQEGLSEILAAGERAAELTRQLLAFSRQQIVRLRIVNLNDIIKGIEKMLRRLIGEDIELTLIPGDDLGNVEVDPGQVEQVVMNLVINSRDAMPNGGKLTIELRNAYLSEEYARVHSDVLPGDYVMLAVTDNGVGMDHKTQRRIFEPFFTTKEVGKGTGLGLATVYGIIRQNNGHVWVYSEVGKGTTFKAYFPCTNRASNAAESAPPDIKSLRGTETILLVEDDPHVRRVCRTILRRAGYHVIEAPGGGDAVLICEQHEATIHLLLTDVVMPRISGRQLVERLQPIRPNMKVLYMSGYTENSIVHHGVLDPGIAFIQKPITPEALLKKVREVLLSPGHA